MDGLVDGWVVFRSNRWIGKLMIGWMGGCGWIWVGMFGWMGGRTDGRMDGCVGSGVYLCLPRNWINTDHIHYISVPRPIIIFVSFRFVQLRLARFHEMKG